MPLLRIIAACLVTSLPAVAQPARNVIFGHIHIRSANPAATVAFWTGVIGAATYSRDSVNGVSMLGALILIDPIAPTGPSAGSAIDHIALRIPDLQPYIAKLAKTPYKTTMVDDRLMIEGPDGVRIELTEDNSMYASLEFAHIHLHAPDPVEAQAWYGKTFGARHNADDPENASRLAGITVMFTKSDSVQPTAGRAIDHLAFEGKDVTAGFITDPWGTRIELIEAH